MRKPLIYLLSLGNLILNCKKQSSQPLIICRLLKLNLNFTFFLFPVFLFLFHLSEDQVFLKEITRGVLEGNNVGWLNWPRLKKLMQNENLRAQVISQLNPQDNTIKEEHIDDVVRSSLKLLKGRRYFARLSGESMRNVRRVH